MKNAILLLLVSLTPVIAQNSGKISGIVRDAKTKEPIPGVNVVIKGTMLGAATDVDGAYFILKVPPGTFEVTASIVGYQRVTQNAVQVHVNRTTTLDFALQQVTIDLGQEVVITAMRPDVEKEKTSTSEIRRGEEVLNVPGIQDISDVLTLSSDISDGHFRGGRDNEELYNLQGMGIMNPLNSATAFNPIMSAVEEVEIITSGFGAQYGNAQSGIVNITMKEGSSSKWVARAESRMRAPGLKHFGPSVWDPNANPYLALLDSPQKWLGGDPNYPNGYWGGIGSGYANRYGKDTTTLATMLYTLWLLQGHREYGKNYDNLLDYSLDANVGGPLANNVRLFLAFHTDNTWPILPTPEPNLSRQLMGNIVYDFRSGMSLRFSGAYSKADGHTLSGTTSTGWYNWIWDRVFSVKRTIDENIQLGLRWTHAISPSTFYEIKLNSLRTTSLDGSPVTNPGRLDGVSSLLVWEGWTNLPDGFNYGQLDNDFSSEKTRTISHDGSITTQYSAKPYEVGLYVQDKMEFEGMIANVGLRLDVYNANVMYYTDTFAPYRYTDSLGLQRVDERYASKAKTPVIARLQPRAGFSFPVSTQTVFHVNYGTFLQRPPFVRIISQTVNRKELYSYGGALSVVGTLGNPTLRPEITSSYDIGVTQALGEGFTLDMSGYYKDVRDLLQQAIYSSKQGNYVTYINRDYADIRGFRVGIAKRSGMLTGTLNYTYGVATGKNSSSDGNQIPTIYESGPSKDPVPQDILMDFDRTHNLVANVGFNTPQGWGPVLFDVFPLERVTIAATSFARSGRPYTSRLNPGILMNKRAPNEFNTNLKITKQISRFFGASASFYLEISNLFNTRIYNYTTVFNPDINNTSNLSKWTIKYEKGEDITYYEDDLRPGFLINQEFRIYSNQPRSAQFGMIINF
ncbi:MAG: carboxypeptidase regulatory-like domain-containing protein [Ignavibacteriales bacterium]|nr:carboxypeptidase regulatory-like domain-containing protein [Ignavibacteriales bacterium]